MKLNVGSFVQGDVVLECLHVDDGRGNERLMFRVMFNTFFIQSHILLLNFEDIDVPWDADHQFTKNFKAEVGHDFSCMHVAIHRQIYQC